jgi:UDP-2,3-diacylglucosamine hydrolase
VKDKVYFISDIHLGLESKEREAAKEQKLVELLYFMQESAKTLYIVGDLFDYWFEYRRVLQKGFFRTFTALQDLTRSGTEVHFIIGNHDFMHRDFFKKELGIIVHEDPVSVTIDGKKFFIAHGDGLVANDLGYRILKKIFRNKFFQFLYSLVHPDFGVWLASGSSKSSRKYTNTKDYGEQDSMFLAAKGYIEKTYDYVIFGHSHKKSVSPYKGGYYINLGSWLEQPCYGAFYNKKFEVLDWKENVTRI